jgi:hypothetical protein
MCPSSHFVPPHTRNTWGARFHDLTGPITHHDIPPARCPFGLCRGLSFIVCDCLCRELVCGTVAFWSKVPFAERPPAVRPFSPRGHFYSSETNFPTLAFDSPSSNIAWQVSHAGSGRIASSYLASNEHQATGIHDVLAIGLPAFAFPRPMPRPAKEAAMAVGVYF